MSPHRTRRILALLAVALVLLACGTEAGTRDGRCLAGDVCGSDDLVCGDDGRCHYCGGHYQPCCAGDVCDDERDACDPEGMCMSCGWFDAPCCPGGVCREGGACQPDNMCRQCGWRDTPCCDDRTCQEGYTCSSDDLCHSCGWPGQICCDDDRCLEGHGLCGDQGVCLECGLLDQICCEDDTCWGDGYVCGADDLCHPCGREDLPCCAKESCDPWAYCIPQGTCAACGSLGEVSCPGGSCQGWFVSQADLCVSPFAVDPSTDASICDGMREGSNDRSERDWCYWYAAYQLQDVAICEGIEWEDMKEHCVAGHDPEDYYILWGF